MADNLQTGAGVDINLDEGTGDLLLLEEPPVVELTQINRAFPLSASRAFPLRTARAFPVE